MIDSKDLKENLPLRIVQGIAVVAVIYWIFSPSAPKEAKTVNPQDAVANMLWNMIESRAKDPSSLKFGKETRAMNTVCMEANGKNSFGAYTGFRNYCLVTQPDGSNRLTIDGEIQK